MIYFKYGYILRVTKDRTPSTKIFVYSKYNVITQSKIQNPNRDETFLRPTCCLYIYIRNYRLPRRDCQRQARLAPSPNNTRRTSGEGCIMGEERGMERKKGASPRSREGWYNTCSVRFHPSHRRRQSSARPVRYLIRFLVCHPPIR